MPIKLIQRSLSCPTVVPQAIAADHELWFWHDFFGMPGANNDLTVLCRSPLFNKILKGTASAANYTVNDRLYTMGYYLADGIYPDMATIVKSLRALIGVIEHNFNVARKAARKAIE